MIEVATLYLLKKNYDFVNGNGHAIFWDICDLFTN